MSPNRVAKNGTLKPPTPISRAVNITEGVTPRSTAELPSC